MWEGTGQGHKGQEVRVTGAILLAGCHGLDKSSGTAEGSEGKSCEKSDRGSPRSIFVSQDGSNKVPHPTLGGLNNSKFTFSQLWRPEVQRQGVGRVDSF